MVRKVDEGYNNMLIRRARRKNGSNQVERRDCSEDKIKSMSTDTRSIEHMWAC